MDETAGAKGQVGAVKPEGAAERRPEFVDAVGAPLVYFEAAPAARFFGGMITIPLVSTKIVSMSDGTVETVPVCVGYLKGTREALASLRSSIDTAFMIAMKPEGNAN